MKAVALVGLVMGALVGEADAFMVSIYGHISFTCITHKRGRCDVTYTHVSLGVWPDPSFDVPSHREGFFAQPA